MAGFTFTPLTPSAYLDRAAWVFRDRTAVVDGERSFTYAEFADRAHRLAGALLGLGVQPRRPGRRAVREQPHHAGAAQRRAAGRGGARSAQHPAVAGRADLHRPPQRRPDPGRHRRAGRCGHRRRGGGRGQARHRRRRAGRIRGSSWPRPARPPSPARTSAGCWPSATPAAPPAGPRASCTTTAAPTCRRSRPRSTPGSPPTASTCGRCPCSTAMAGASPGRRPRPAPPTCACAPSIPPDLGAAPNRGGHPLQRRPHRAHHDRQRAGGRRGRRWPRRSRCRRAERPRPRP